MVLLVFTVHLVTWQCCSTLSRDWVSIFFFYVLVYSVAFGHDLVSDSRQSLVMSTAFCGLFQFVCLWTEASCVCAADVCMTLRRNKTLFTLFWIIQTIFRSLSWLELNLCRSLPGLWLEWPGLDYNTAIWCSIHYWHSHMNVLEIRNKNNCMVLSFHCVPKFLVNSDLTMAMLAYQLDKQHIYTKQHKKFIVDYLGCISQKQHKPK